MSSVTTIKLEENNVFVYELGLSDSVRATPKEFTINGESSQDVLNQLNNAIMSVLNELNMPEKLGNVLVSYRNGNTIEESVIEQDGKFSGQYSISVVRHSIDYLDATDNTLKHYEL